MVADTENLDRSIRYALPFCASKRGPSFIVTNAIWLLCFFVTPSSRATTVVIMFSKDQLVIAADSFITLEHGGSGTVSEMCKIRQVGSFFFVPVGTYRGAGGFDVFSIAEAALKTSGTLADKLNAFKARVEKPALDVIRDSVENNPAAVGRWRKGAPFLEIVMAGVENDRFVALGWGAKVTAAGTLSPYEFACRGPEQYVCDHVLGEREQIQNWERRNPEKRFDSPVEGARTLLIMEIHDSNSKAGGAPSILVIERGSAHWETRGHCQEIRTPK